jgi:chromosome segregation ATPase
MIDSYELGQLLRILLWILMPAVLLIIIINTWLQYRRKWKLADQMFLYEGPSEERGPREEVRVANEEVEAIREEALPAREEDLSVREEVPPVRVNWEMDAANERIYKGVLWMKEKYEQFREFADRRYELVKEELSRVQKQYQNLLDAAPAEAGVVVLEEKNGQIGHLQRQLEEKQELIDDLQAQLVAGKQKIEDLVARLQESSEHLMSIHRVLDRSVYPSSDAEAEVK